MKIDSYRFGQITVDGRSYGHDVVLTSAGARPWVRAQSHSLLREEAEPFLESDPEVVIIGTGAMGVMEVSSEAISCLEAAGVEVVVTRTGRACDLFNELIGKKDLVAALHLTC